jgi:hypothetical protein
MMMLLRNKGFIVALIYTFAVNPVFSKSFFCAGEMLTESGQFNPEYFTTVLSYSPLLILSDLACTLIAIYYFKKFKRYSAKR